MNPNTDAPATLPDLQAALAGLKDLHLPEAVSFWPLAVGWWVLLITLILLTSGLLFYRKKIYHYGFAQWHRYQFMKAFTIIKLRHQKTGNDAELITQLAELLRRIALSLYPKQMINELSGQSWLGFLDKTGATQDFSTGAGQALEMTRYALKPQQSKLTDLDSEALLAVCRCWIEQQPERRAFV